jgi:1-acyl-sn-glycerol-3-phosphate acyltransferase
MPDIPRIANPPLHACRVLMKWLSFLVFGLSCVVLILVVFPPALLVLRPRETFRRRMRLLVHHSMRCFVRFMHLAGIVDLEVPAEDREALRRLSSKIIVANHPSLVDVLVIFSLVPNADCIVQGYVSRTIMRTIVRQIYILNTLSARDLVDDCAASLRAGNCLVIFPEGTRTPRTGAAPALKKGAARIALLSGCDIIPLRIGGADKYGLGKHDPWTAFSPAGRYVYRIRVCAPISPANRAGLPLPRAMRQLTGEIQRALFDNKDAS